MPHASRSNAVFSDPALAQPDALVACARRAFGNALAVYAFGSRAQPPSGAQVRADSDLDIAVLVAGYADPLRLWHTADELSALCGCPVDLLDLRAASTVMQYQVLTTGQRLWGLALEAGLFECFVMSEKLALDEARAGLLADIARQGRIHGR